MAAAVADPSEAAAQEVQQFETPLSLPRSGYEAKNVRVGRFVIAPELEISETYDSNIFARNDNVEDDFVTRVTPRATITTDPGKFNLSSSLFVTANHFAKNTSESTPTFGVNVASSYFIDSANTISGGLTYGRRIETREEQPELSDSQELATVDDGEGEVMYAYRRNRIGIAFQGVGRRVDYDDSDDDDLDRWEYGGGVRGSYLVTPRFNAFVEPSILRREFDNENAGVDAGGTIGGDVDGTTYGFLVGTEIDIADKWAGQVGVGVFHVDNDSGERKDFTGLGINTALTWSITPQTAVTGLVSRQDVASVTGGAAGRVDTRVAFGLEQELRHNIVLTAEAGVEVSQFEDSSESDLITPAGLVSGRYLFNRYVSAFATLGYSQRFADDSDEEFNRFFSTIGLTFRL